mgnify:CR=1 FL=1
MTAHTRNTIFIITCFLVVTCTYLMSIEPTPHHWTIPFHIGRGWDVLVFFVSFAFLTWADKLFNWWRNTRPNMNPHAGSLVLFMGITALAGGVCAGHINNLAVLVFPLIVIPIMLGFIRGVHSPFGRQSIDRHSYEVMAVVPAAFFGNAIGYGVTNSFVIGIGVGIIGGIATGLAMLIGFATILGLKNVAYNIASYKGI